MFFFRCFLAIVEKNGAFGFLPAIKHQDLVTLPIRACLLPYAERMDSSGFFPLAPCATEKGGEKAFVVTSRWWAETFFSFHDLLEPERKKRERREREIIIFWLQNILTPLQPALSVILLPPSPPTTLNPKQPSLSPSLAIDRLNQHVVGEGEGKSEFEKNGIMDWEEK